MERNDPLRPAANEASNAGRLNASTILYLLWFLLLIAILGLGASQKSTDLAEAIGSFAGRGLILVAFTSVPYLFFRYRAKASGAKTSWPGVLASATIISLTLALGGMYGKIDDAERLKAAASAPFPPAAPTYSNLSLPSDIATIGQAKPLIDKQVSAGVQAAQDQDEQEIPEVLFERFSARNAHLLQDVSREQVQDLINAIDRERDSAGLRRLSSEEVLEEVRSALEKAATARNSMVSTVQQARRPECERKYVEARNALSDEIPVGQYSRLLAEIDEEMRLCMQK